MREIKFRAYAQNSEVMVYQKDFNKWLDGFMMYVEFQPEEDDETEFVTEFIWIENEGENYTVDNPPVYSGDDMVEVMQYTGLKDKNGQEIYEGDYLKGGALHLTDGFQIDNVVGATVYFANGMFKCGSVSLISLASRAEVIGNVYQHPHLLKGATNGSS